MTKDPSFVFLVTGQNALQKLRAQIGPTDPEVARTSNSNSIRALFGSSILENAIHAPSDGKESGLMYQIFGEKEVIDAGLGIEG